MQHVCINQFVLHGNRRYTYAIIQHSQYCHRDNAMQELHSRGTTDFTLAPTTILRHDRIHN